MRVGAWLVKEQNMGCGTSRPREMQVIHSPYPWYGGRVAPGLEQDESFMSAPPHHSTSWWFSDQLDLDDSYPPHHILVPQENTQCTADPPPYTEVAQNGHISLMHGQSPVKPVETSQEGGDQDADTNNMDSSTLTANNVSVLEASQSSEDGYDHSSPWIHAMADSSPNASSDSPSQSQSPFHPTRQSTPTLGRRQVLPVQLPPLHRNSSIDTSGTPTTDGNHDRQQRHSLPSVPLSLFSSLPATRLRPISTLFAQQDSNNEAPDSMENVGPFPTRPGRRLPPLQPINSDQQRRVSIGSDVPNQLQRRRKKKRKRTNSWHGERLGSEMIHTIQEVNTLGVVTE